MAVHQFAITSGDAELASFRTTMANELRRIADEVERNSEKYVAIVLATCDYEGVGGPFVIIDSDAATVELVDEISDTLKNAMFEAIE